LHDNTVTVISNSNIETKLCKGGVICFNHMFFFYIQWIW